MKKSFRVFSINDSTNLLIDKGWRFDTYEEAEEAVNDFNYDEELVILPVYIPTKLQ